MRFVLIDRILTLEPGKRAVATKTFSPDETFFADHFPGFPVVPGVLLTEAMGQAGGWLLASETGLARWPLLSLIDRATFRRLVRPLEVLTLEATVRSRRGDDVEIRAEARVGEERVADARLLFHLFEPPAVRGEGPSAFDAWARETFDRLISLAADAPPGEIRA